MRNIYNIVREKHANQAWDFVLKEDNITARRMAKAVARSYIRAMGKDESGHDRSDEEDNIRKADDGGGRKSGPR